MGEELTVIGDMDMLVKIGIDMLSQNIEEIMEGNEDSEIMNESDLPQKVNPFKKEGSKENESSPAKGRK